MSGAYCIEVTTSIENSDQESSYVLDAGEITTSNFDPAGRAVWQIWCNVH
jgi:hypothetical protein